MQEQRWIRMPGPGQFRGQGTWYRLESTGHTVKDYEYIKQTGYLPTYEGEIAPDED